MRAMKVAPELGYVCLYIYICVCARARWCACIYIYICVCVMRIYHHSLNKIWNLEAMVMAEVMNNNVTVYIRTYIYIYIHAGAQTYSTHPKEVDFGGEITDFSILCREGQPPSETFHFSTKSHIYFLGHKSFIKGPIYHIIYKGKEKNIKESDSRRKSGCVVVGD